MRPLYAEFSVPVVAVASRICSRAAYEYRLCRKRSIRGAQNPTHLLTFLEIIMKLAAIASSIVATSIFALAGAAAPSVAVASPNDGVKCPNGYEAKFAGGALSCSIKVVDDIS